MMRKALCCLVTGLIFTSSAAIASDSLRQEGLRLFGVLPDSMPGSDGDTAALVALGKRLYMDPGLSDNQSQSCNTCHNVQDDGPGVDNEQFSTGAFGEKGGRNAPTVWNAGFQLSQFWDGRAADLVEQAKGPVLNPVEMAMSSSEKLEERLQAMPEYQQAFTAAFGDDAEITYDNVAGAIAAFERTLITEDRFDRWLEGDDSAMDQQEIRGLQAFIDIGCSACHNGPTLGGNMYQKMGLVNDYGNQADQGRFDLTANEADRMIFKVPMLRDIARTAPYFHDGSVATLDEAVRQMAWLQRGIELNNATVEDITAFLEALTHEG